MLLGDALDTATQPTQTVGFTSLLDDILKAGTAYLTFDQQRNLNTINAQRLSQGLPPISSDDYGAQVNVGLSSGTKNMLLWLGGGIAAALLVSAMMKRKR